VQAVQADLKERLNGDIRAEIAAIFSCMFLRLSFPWAAGSSLLMLALFLLFTRDCIAEAEAFFIDAVYLSLGTISSILGAYSIEFHLRHSYWQARQLDQARLQHQTLLHSILPPSIATRLKRGEEIIADDKQVSVLFADIVGSVKLATSLGSAKLVDLLNQIFSEFDCLVDQHGLEVIKTIGDGYMVAGNCSVCLADHVRAIADLAIAMQSAISRYRHLDGQPISLRIGIHTGPVIAGVMKLRKLSYDLWGDTVNIASRMESHADQGAIQVTQEVRAVLGSEYEYEGPSPIEVKGKGWMSVYRLIDKAPAPSHAREADAPLRAHSLPNPEASRPGRPLTMPCARISQALDITGDQPLSRAFRTGKL
jgi:class 3 adenylate cyclase